MVRETGRQQVLAFALALLLLTVACGEEGMPTPTPTPLPEAAQLAYVGDEGDVWLTNADGSGKKRLIEGNRCPYVLSLTLTWSPAGDRLACLGLKPDNTFAGQRHLPSKVVIVDAGGHLLKEIDFVGSFAWSPTGRHMAYSVLHWTPPEVSARYHIADAAGNVIEEFDGVEGDIVWSPDGTTIAYNADFGKVIIYDVTSKQRRSLGIGVDRALAWVLGGKAMLVASKYQEFYGFVFFVQYEAHLLELDSGRLTRVAQLDNYRHLWLSPDGGRAAFLSGRPPRPEGGATISVLDFATLSVSPIQGSAIGFPGEGIPSNHMAFSPDGLQIFWADVTSGTVYRARSDGTRLTKVATLPSFHIRFSPDLTKVAYVVPGSPGGLWTANIDGGDAIQIGPSRSGFAWRPVRAE